MINKARRDNKVQLVSPVRREMFLLSLVVSLLPLLVRPQCQVEPSPENVVSTQLEGSWIPDLTARVGPTTTKEMGDDGAAAMNIDAEGPILLLYHQNIINRGLNIKFTPTGKE